MGASASPSISPSISPSYSPSGSMSPSVSPSYSPSGSMSPSLSPSASPSGSMSPSYSPSASPSASPSISPSHSSSTSYSESPSLSGSSSVSPSVSPSTASFSGSQYIRITNPWFLEQDNNGRPAAGYLVWTLQAGTVDTLVTTYADKDLTVSNTNPVVLNERGEANIFTGTEGIKLVFTAPGGDLTSPIWTEDYVTEESNDVVGVGTASGTANNIYIVNITPSYVTIPDGFSLVMIPDVTNLDTLITRTFTGTGINDPVFSGPYVGVTASIFSVQIDATPGGASPDTFKWRKDAGAWTTGVAITSNLQTLEEGFAVTFSEVQGHTLNDLWTYSVRPPAYLRFCGLGPNIIYKSVDGALQALSGGDIIAGIPAHMDWSASQSAWILLNPTQPVLTSQIPARMRKEIIADYNVLVADTGKELSCSGTFTVTLPACTEAVNKFYYINNVGTGIITVAAAGGTDLIILPGITVGVPSFELRRTTWFSVQLVTNGANWHMTTETTLLHGSIELDGSDWTCPPWVTNAQITGVAGGGGGGSNTGGGGKAGEWTLWQALVLVPGTVYSSVIGVGGAGGTGGSDGSAGTNTQFGESPAVNMVVLAGGAGGTAGAGMTAGENSLFGKGGAEAGGVATSKGSGGGGGDVGANGGKGADGRLFLVW